MNSNLKSVGKYCLKLFLIFTLPILILMPHALNAQDTGSGLDFLNISPSANLLSIAEAQSAVPSGAASVYTNPALLTLEQTSALDIHYTLWIAEVTNQFAAVNLRKNNRSIGFGVYSSKSDGFAARNQPGPPQGDFSIGYLSLAGSYAYKLGPVSFGATGQYLREEVFQHRANGFAISVGTAGQLLEQRLTIGIAVMNLGKMEDLNNEATQLPSSFRGGLSARLVNLNTPGFENLPVLISIHTEWMKPLEDSPSSDFIDSDRKRSFLNLGLTANFSDIIELKGGFKLGPTERPLSFGAGLNIDPIQVNYAIVPFSTGFGTAHSIGLQYFF